MLWTWFLYLSFPGVSQAAENMADRIQAMQKKVRQKLGVTNAKYKKGEKLEDMRRFSMFGI